MAFSLEMIDMPGHDDVPEHVTIEYLRQTQYSGRSAADPPFSCSSPPSARGDQPSLEVHGRPVPGDRDFRGSKLPRNQGGSLDPLFLSEDFAPKRFEEMRKMLRIMLSTHEKNFGSHNSRDRLKQGLEVLGLEDEHKQYVENFENEWRAVGKLLRCRPKEKYDESAECSVSDVSSHLELESCYSSEMVEVDGTPSSSNHAPVELGNFDEGTCSPHEKVKDVLEDENVGRGRERKAKGKVPVQADDYEEGEDEYSESSQVGADVIDDDRGGPLRVDTNLSNAGPRSRIPPEGTDEHFWDESHREAKCSSAHDNVDILEKVICNESVSPDIVKPEHGLDSGTGNATSLALSGMNPERNTSGVDAEEIRVRENPAKGSRRLHSKFTPPQTLVIPSDPENPIESSSFQRTPDRRNSDPFSPFKDRSNIPSVSEPRRTPRRLQDEGRRPKPNSWVSGLRTPEKSPKRLASLDSRRRPDLRGNLFLSNVSEDVPDLPSIPKPRLPRSASIDMRLTTPRGKAVDDDGKVSDVASTGVSESSNQLDIPPLPAILSPILVERRDKDCAVSEPMHRCVVCAGRQARRVANGGERSPIGKSGSRSPYSSHQVKNGRNTFGAPDASPEQSTIKKSSGIFTPLMGTKKPNVLSRTNSSRQSPSVDLADSDKAFRRTSSMRSTEESPRSTGVLGSSNESKSGLEETPTLRKSATSLSERTHTPKEKLTPGGPRRGGKVDRVARFAEMQNLWKSDKFLNASGKRKSQSFYRIFSELHESHERFYAAYRERVTEAARSKDEQPPFVVPLNSSSDRIRSPRAIL